MKIYNEISIDMNPESSSYGETLHEDSFDYEGPMVLLQYGHGGRQRTGYQSTDDTGYASTMQMMRNYKGYKSFQTFGSSKEDGIFLMERSGAGGKTEWVIFDWDGNIKQTLDNTYSYDRAVSRARGFQEQAATEAAPGYVAPVVPVAPDIKYSDFSQYLDESGNVSDITGMRDYLKTMPGMTQDETKLDSLISNMPNLSVGAGELRGAESQYQTDIYGVQSQLGGLRQKQASQTGVSGVYSPISTGFGAGDETMAQGLYGQIGELQTGAQDMYGLGGQKEKEFADWIARSTGLGEF
jgi:hypothetical protein